MNILERWLGRAVIFRWIVVGIIILAAMIWGYFIINDNTPKILLLPVYGQPNSDNSDHTIADFNFIDQDGKKITQDDYKDKIYVADFFFTTCQGICPRMSDQMERVAERYNGDKKFKLLSHTVKPEEDSISVLKQYANDHHANSGQWHFVTGEKKVIDDIAKNSYMVSGTGGEPGAEFVHTQFFILIDPQRRIRGFYDGTDSLEVNKLISDIGILEKEE